ncbi:MAG: hypothetical protein DRG50_08555 [Deltaproteobacteria bacterium]|nr:MAG: hypothetical protein DRG50_08555 [Deltaproteobacteria bacterium]
MRILLIQPPSGGIGFTDLIRGEPLGLEMVAGALEGHEVKILDLRLGGNLFSTLSSFKPDLCGISCSYTIDCYPTIKIAQKIKNFFPDTFVFVGGHHASLNPADFATEAINAVIIGEGEETTKELIETWEKKGDLREVAGVAINDVNEQIITSVRPLIEDLDTLPFPQRANKKGGNGYHLGFQKPLALVETSRGCFYQCSFCSVWQFYRRRYRSKSPERVIEELRYVKEPYILFVDDNFLVDVSRAEKIAHMIKAEKIKKSYTFQARSDTIARYPDILRSWKEVGLRGVFIGFEKIEDEGLQAIHKNNEAENNEKALRILQALNIDIWASFIVDPDYDCEDFERLKKYIISRNIKTPTFSVLTPLPGTQLFYQLRERLITEDYNLFDIAHAVLPTKLSLKEFYKEFCSLYHLPYSKYQLIWEGFRAWLMRGFSLSRLLTMLQAAKRLSDPKYYLIAHEHQKDQKSPPSNALAKASTT